MTSNNNTNNNTNTNTIQAPSFTAAPLASQTQQVRGTPATLNLDDIFGDCFFTPEGDAVFLSEQQAQQGDEDEAGSYTTSYNNNNNNNNNNFAESMNIQISGESSVSNVASRPIGTNDAGIVQFAPVMQAGGIATTGLANSGVKATVMGPATTTTATATATGQQQTNTSNNSTSTSTSTKFNPIAAPPQQRHHLQFATTIPSGGGTKKRVGLSAREKKMSDQQKSERRERNREHAKRSRIRKKILLESLQQSVSLLKEENDKLRSSIRQHLGDTTADELLTKENLENTNVNSLIASNSKDANKVLDDPDFSFIKALQTAQQNFVVTDPSLPDNPIVYATQGFLSLTGYSLDQVLGRNCRFLQGPETDPKAVEKIRRSIEEGADMSVCLLNYRVDGTTFWNQFFISALRDAAGNITNYVGVQCKVSDQYAANVCKKQEEEFANSDAAVETDETAAPTSDAVLGDMGESHVVDMSSSARPDGAVVVKDEPVQIDGFGDTTMQ